MNLKSSLLLLGHIGSYNAGDDAVCLSFIKTLSELSLPIRRVYVQANNDYIKSHITTNSVLLRRGINQLLPAFIESKYIVLNGGDYLDDFGSRKRRLRAFILILLISILAFLLGKQFLIINNGIRSTSVFGNSLIKIILTLTKVASVRDAYSLNLVKDLGMTEIGLGFDTAVLHGYFTKQNFDYKIPSSAKERRILGISLTPFYMNFFSKKHLDLLISDKFSQALNSFLAKWTDTHIWFFSFNTSQRAGDIRSIKHVLSRIKDEYQDRLRIIEYDGHIEKFLTNLEKVDLFLTCKYHSIIFSFMLAKPMIIFLYHPKCFALYKELGLAVDAKLSIKQVLNNSLGDSLHQLQSDPRKFIPIMSLENAQTRAIEGIRWCFNFQQRK